MAENTRELLWQCCVCRLPHRTPEELERTTHGMHNDCIRDFYPEIYRQMEKEGKL